MYKIIEYNRQYEKAAKQLMIDISVKEFGFKEFEKDFLNANYDKYKKSGGIFLIVLNKNNVIGTMALQKEGSVGYLSGVYLNEKYRGKGIAQKLLETIIQYSRENLINKIVLNTYERYSRAIGFYEKNNFVRFEEHKDKYYYMLELKKEL